MALQRRQLRVSYLGFDDDNNGIPVDDLSDAALVFNGNNDTFVSDDDYLGTSVFRRAPLQRFPDFPTGFSAWEMIGIFAELVDTAGFCLGSDNIVSAYLTTDLCTNPITLVPTSE